MYIQNPAHTAHKCTQILIFLYIKHLSIFMIVCKIKNLCAKRVFCVQNEPLCAKCVHVCAVCVQKFRAHYLR